MHAHDALPAHNYYFITLFEIFKKFFRFVRLKFTRFWLKIRDSGTSPSSSRHLPGLSVGSAIARRGQPSANCRKNNKMKIPQQAEAKFLYKDRHGRHNLCKILSTSYPHPATCGKKRKIVRTNKLLKHNLILKIEAKMIKYPGRNRILSVCYYIITLLLRTIPNF